MEYYFGFAKELLDKGLAETAAPYGKDNLYDLTIQFDDDLDFYLSLAEKKHRVLDLACGTGRLLLPLLKNQVDAVGVDNSVHMLDIAKTKCLAYGYCPVLYHADMRSFTLQERFDLVVIPYHSMMYMLTDEDRKKVFTAVYHHLNKNGLLAFDFDTSSIPIKDTIPALGLQGVHPFTNEVMVQIVQIRGLQSDLRLLNQINYFIGENPRITAEYSLEATISADHMVNILRSIGFLIEGVYGDYNRSEYKGGSECIIAARKGDNK